MSLAPFVARAQASARVVVIGGGFAGTLCARTMKKLDPKLSVILVEPEKSFTAYPFSNDVLGGFRERPSPPRPKRPNCRSANATSTS